MLDNHNTNNITERIDKLVSDYADVLSEISNKNHILKLLTKFKIETWKWFKAKAISDREVARILGISNTTISHWRKKIGLEKWRWE